MIKKEICVKSLNGMESKYAAVLIQKASNFKSNIWLEKNYRRANAKSLLGVLALMVGKDEKVIVEADGEDETTAVFELEKFFLTSGKGDAK